MKRIINILLILLFIYNSCGYVVIYYELRSAYKKEAKEKITEYVNADDIEVISVKKSELDTKLKFVEDHEFIYNNSMYDICRKVETEDMVIFYCLNDKNETVLFNKFASYFNAHTDQSGKKTTPINNLMFLLSNFIAQYENDSINYKTEALASFILRENCILKEIYLDIPTPPPKFI